MNNNHTYLRYNRISIVNDAIILTKYEAIKQKNKKIK